MPLFNSFADLPSSGKNFYRSATEYLRTDTVSDGKSYVKLAAVPRDEPDISNEEIRARFPKPGRRNPFVVTNEIAPTFFGLDQFEAFAASHLGHTTTKDRYSEQPTEYVRVSETCCLYINGGQYIQGERKTINAGNWVCQRPVILQGGRLDFRVYSPERVNELIADGQLLQSDFVGKGQGDPERKPGNQDKWIR